MKKWIVVLLSVSAMFIGMTRAELNDSNDVSSLKSLRGTTKVEETRPADSFKHFSNDSSNSINTNYVEQPPLIPHAIRNYEVSMNANKCLACHSWKNAKEMNAPKVSITHFTNQEGQTLSDVSPRRYFCLQCHVPQADAKPLIENEFQPVNSLR